MPSADAANNPIDEGEQGGLEEKIRQWVVRSGRDIEMRVAEEARAAGAIAVQSVPYTDPITGKDRETDVLAEFSGNRGSDVPVTLVIECKSAPGHHWVTFPYRDGRISSQPIQHHALVQSEDFLRAELLNQAWTGGNSIFGPDRVMSTALVQADLKPTSGERVKSAQAAVDSATGALWQVWSAAQGLLMDNNGAGVHWRIIVPVIVTGAQLWDCYIDEDGEMQLVTTDYMRVRTPSTGNAVLVHVMGLPRFRRFVRQMKELQARRRR